MMKTIKKCETCGKILIKPPLRVYHCSKKAWEKKKYCSRECFGKRGVSQETRRKMSRTNKGRKLTKEWKNKISKTLMGRKPTKETRRKRSETMMGHPFWGKKEHSEETKRKMSKSAKRGKNNHMWKGDEVGYDALHQWVYRHKGKPKTCLHCGKTNGKLHWANMTQQYERKLDNFASLCVSCHKQYDLNRNNFV